MDPAERGDIIEWLVLPNEVILKSDRYENLINDACLYYYKETVNNISEDTLAFVRRSANELLRNKASKEAIRKKLLQAQANPNEGPIGDMIPARNPFGQEDPSQLSYIMQNVGFGC